MQKGLSDKPTGLNVVHLIAAKIRCKNQSKLTANGLGNGKH